MLKLYCTVTCNVLYTLFLLAYHSGSTIFNLAVIFRRGYTDRKKKIIREWNKTNPSPRASETLTSDPLRQSASYLSGHELFQHPPTLTYNPYGVKDEPLRTDYPYYGYPELVNPYVHMTHRREKRKKQDSLPGGQTLTRDERKVAA